jgi:hypothetical protein
MIIWALFSGIRTMLIVISGVVICLLELLVLDVFMMVHGMVFGDEERGHHPSYYFVASIKRLVLVILGVEINYGLLESPFVLSLVQVVLIVLVASTGTLISLSLNRWSLKVIWAFLKEFNFATFLIYLTLGFYLPIIF